MLADDLGEQWRSSFAGRIRAAGRAGGAGKVHAAGRRTGRLSRLSLCGQLGQDR